jgi:hypothetical protein
MAIEDLKKHMNLAHLLFNIAKKNIFGYRCIASQKKVGSNKTKQSKVELVCSIYFNTVWFLFCRSGCLFSLAQKHNFGYKLFQLLVCLLLCLFLHGSSHHQEQASFHYHPVLYFPISVFVSCTLSWGLGGRRGL